MGKFDAVRRLSKKQVDELFINFAKALASVRNSVEAANLIKDLLTESEVIILARRLQIATLLLQGYTYEQIHKLMRVGNSTIAKIHAWMDLYGDGFRTVIKRTHSKYQNRDSSDAPLSWSKHKRKYPMHYWPELLLKQIIKSASKKEKQKLLNVVAGMKEKTKLNKEIIELLHPVSNSHNTVYGR